MQQTVGKPFISKIIVASTLSRQDSGQRAASPAELKALQTLCDGFVEACNLNALTSIYILYDP